METQELHHLRFNAYSNLDILLYSAVTPFVMVAKYAGSGVEVAGEAELVEAL